MRTPAPLPPELNQQGFAVRTAILLGLPRSRVRSVQLATPLYGLRHLAGTPQNLLDLCRSLQEANPDAVISHTTAAELWDMALPLRLSNDDRLHLTVAAPARARRISGTVGHQSKLLDGQVVRFNGITMTSPERTWCDLSAMGNLPDLVAAGDSLLRRRAPRSSVDAIQTVARRYGGRRGMNLIRTALPLLRAGADSAPESHLRLLMQDEGFPEPVLTTRLYDSAGRYLSEPDLAILQYKIAIQYDGDGHRTSKAQWRSDIFRDEVTRDDNWDVFQFTGDDVYLHPAVSMR